MRAYAFVFDSGRKSEGLRVTVIRAENLEQAQRSFGAEDIDFANKLYTPFTLVETAVRAWTVKASSGDDIVHVIFDLGEVR